LQHLLPQAFLFALRAVCPTQNHQPSQTHPIPATTLPAILPDGTSTVFHNH
jgi:hypothetical protein